jgi:glycosyltransferase involved in cell wall biosynthesis
LANTIPSTHIVGSRLYGGAEHFYVRLVQILRDSGHPVLAINRAGTPVAEALSASGIDQLYFPMANGWDIVSLWRMRKTLEVMQPGIVQTYMGRATRLTHLSPKTKGIHVARLGEYYKIDGYYRHAHAWIGNTKGICDYLVKSGLPTNKVFYIGNFVPEPPAITDIAKQAARREYAIPQDCWVIFSLGRLVENKGFQDLLNAFSLLPREIEGKPLVLLIAGDGPYAPALHALTKELGLAEHVRWLGWQNQPDVFYKLADVFICPSQHEPLGNVILEAWNHKLPVISTATLGAVELIKDGTTGLLSPCGDPQALARQIIALLSTDTAERKALSESGQDFLLKHFSPAAIRDSYLELYQQLMAERGY